MPFCQNFAYLNERELRRNEIDFKLKHFVFSANKRTVNTLTVSNYFAVIHRMRLNRHAYYSGRFDHLDGTPPNLLLYPKYKPIIFALDMRFLLHDPMKCQCCSPTQKNRQKTMGTNLFRSSNRKTNNK